MINDRQINLVHGDSLEVLQGLEDNCIDSVVTDPPYGIKFMNKDFDKALPDKEIWAECLRVLKPGGYIIAMSASRMYHRLAVQLEDLGFITHPMVVWLQGQGFPKATDVLKQFEKAGKPELGEQWKGYKFGLQTLKPCIEPIYVGQKPHLKPMIKNIEKWGVGAMNIDATRVETSEQIEKGRSNRMECKSNAFGKKLMSTGDKEYQPQGRHPANLVHDGSEVVEDEFMKQGGVRESAGNIKESPVGKGIYGMGERKQTGKSFHDSGTASRFFNKLPINEEDFVPFKYQAKASKGERNKGLDGTEQIKLESGLCKEENMALVQLLQKVISDQMVKWYIGESGKNIMAVFPKGSLSIIKTEINKIIGLKTLRLLIPLLTSASTQDASLLKENGGSLADYVLDLKEYLLSITNGKVESALGAVNAALRMLKLIRESEGPEKFSNIHSTVKPIALMSWLIKLVTPSNGITLDPFMGSGSTGVAAKKNGLRFLGIELDKEYYEIAEKRINAAN